MKKILMMLSGLFLIHYSMAQQALPVPAYAKEQKPMSWYKEQVMAWEKQLRKNSKDEDAWHNYFRAKRILIFHDESDKREEKLRDQDLKEVVDDMGKAIPDSYEYNFCMWQLGGNDMKLYPYLEKAIHIDPERTDHVDYMVNIGELQRDISKRNEFSLKKYKAGLISAGMMYYNYNTLAGLKPNAILLTSGDNDTYPAWALQAMGFRPDVKVLNLYLLHLKDYREKLFTELGITNVDLNTKAAEEEFFKKDLVKHISGNSKHYPVYMGLTTSGCNNIDAIESNLYLIGLVYEYDTNSFDNMAVLKRNFEKLYALDYLDKSFYEEISADLVKRINQNYIVPMIKLYQHYTASGELQKQAWIKEKLILISKGTEEEETVNKYID